MSVQTVNGASLPAAPTPGAGGFRGYETTGVDSVREDYAEEKRRVREDGTRERLGEVCEDGVENVHKADTVRETLHQSLDLVGAILTVVVAGAAAYAGLTVMSDIASTMGLSEGDMFYNASQSLESGIESFFTQMPTVFVVIALVLVIGYLMVLRR